MARACFAVMPLMCFTSRGPDMTISGSPARRPPCVAVAKPPSRRLPPPVRPELIDGEPLEAYNERAQASSDRCCLCPCPKCGRSFLPERLKPHMRGCEEEAGAREVPPPHRWGPITCVGDGWTLDELQRFCHKRRQERGQAKRRHDLKRVGDRIAVSGAVKRDRWDVNGLSKRELIERINSNLAHAHSQAPPVEQASGLEAFKQWLASKFVAQPKLAARVFSARLVARERG